MYFLSTNRNVSAFDECFVSFLFLITNTGIKTSYTFSFVTYKYICPNFDLRSEYKQLSTQFVHLSERKMIT